MVVGDVPSGLLRRAARAHNVAVAEERPGGLEHAIDALGRAEGTSAPYALVAADPLAETASKWAQMWRPGAGNFFEEAAGSALAAWRARRFELPDYYVVVTERRPSERSSHPSTDFHLGFLRAERPRRVVPLLRSEDEADLAALLAALSDLPQGPWWPAPDRLVEAARTYFAGAIEGDAHALLLE